MSSVVNLEDIVATNNFLQPVIFNWYAISSVKMELQEKML